MTFEEWNSALGRFFFNPSRAGRRVYLHTTRDLLEKLGGGPAGHDDFIAAIKTGPKGAAYGEMCSKAIRIADALPREPFPLRLLRFDGHQLREGNWKVRQYEES